MTNVELARRVFGGVELVAVLGDITKEASDAIVNAANNRLVHGGGVAGAIARSGGSVIVEESRRWVEEHGPVPTGGVAVTGAGALEAKFVIHAVGPRWGEGNEDEKLRSAVRNALRKAAELGCESVSMPAISTGIFGFPKERGVTIIVDEAKRFAENPGSVKQIRFCNIDEETAQLFARELAE